MNSLNQKPLQQIPASFSHNFKSFFLSQNKQEIQLLLTLFFITFHIKDQKLNDLFHPLNELQIILTLSQLLLLLT